MAGSVAGHLERRAGDFVDKAGHLGVGRIGTGTARRLIELARQHGRSGDAVVRQQLVHLYMLTEVNRMSLLRARAANGRSGAEGNIGKLLMAEQMRLAREVGNLILGPGGMLTGPGAPSGGFVQEITVSSPGPSIYGGTDQVQRNIIGERVLGLPKEPGPPKETPFRELLVGTQRD